MDWIDLLLQIDLNFWQETPAESIDPLPWRTDLTYNKDHSPCFTTPSDSPRHHQETAIQPIATPDRFDVVCGRGQGILRLPGNETYRELVALNKRIYARCHKSDKGKVSKGIVATIRKVGGRFLEYDEQTRTYRDIGDKRACMKTSQALREGLPTIRKQIYSDLAAGRYQSGLDTSLLGTSNIPLPEERYFEHSFRYLQVSLNIEFPTSWGTSLLGTSNDPLPAERYFEYSAHYLLCPHNVL